MWRERETSYKAILITGSFFFLYFQDLGVLVLSSVVAAAVVGEGSLGQSFPCFEFNCI